jgi:hypothetical protein
VIIMNQRTTYLITAGAAALLFIGGLVLGNLINDDDPGDVAASPATVAIAAATPADPESDPDGPTERFWPQPSPRQIPAHLLEVVDSPDGPDDETVAASGVSLSEAARPVIVGGVYNPDVETDPVAGGEGEIYLPPTRPGGLDEDGTGEPDPDAPVEVREGVVELGPDVELDGSVDPFAPEPAAPGPLGDPLPFRDPCADVDEVDAEAAEELCPEGVGGTILVPLGGGDGAPEPLAIMGQFYTGISVPLELRCPSLGMGEDGIYRPLFASNNPADFTIRYWLTADASEQASITYRSSDAELERWIEKRLADEPTWANPHQGVHNCPELPMPTPLPANAHVTVEIQGVDDFGSEAFVRFYAYLDARGSRGGNRPPVTFTPMPLGSDVGLLAVPYDPTTEMVYMASIPRNGPRASELSCTEAEGTMLDGRFVSDPSLHEIGVAILAQPPDGPDVDPRFNQVAVARLHGEEGTRYQLCAWVATPATRSFERPTVVHRDSFLVRAPRHLRVRVSVGGGHADQPLEARSVSVRATNWPAGWTGTFPSEAIPARAFMLDGPVLLFDSGGQRVPSNTLIEVVGPTGSSAMLDIETPTRCSGFGGLFTSCPERGTKQYDVQIPGRVVGRGLCGSSFGSCDPPREQTYVGNLRLLVERYSGPGGPPTGGDADGWQVFPHGRFEAAGERERPATPQIDSLNSSLRSGVDSLTGRPSLTMDLRFDRPVRIEAVPWNNFEEACVEPEPYVRDDYSATATRTWRDLCFRGTYSMSLLAVDEDGNTLDLRTIVDGERTGHPGWSYIELPGFPIAEFTVDITIARLGDGMRPQSLNASLGGVSLGTLIAPGHPPRCVTEAVPTSTFSRTIRNDGGRPIQWGDSVVLYLDVAGAGDGYRCGLGERYTRGAILRTLWLDDLLDGPRRLTYDGPDAEIIVEIREVAAGR